MVNNSMKHISLVLMFVGIAVGTVYAESYKGFEWGESAQVLVDREELQFDNGKSYSDIEESSYLNSDIDRELFGLYFDIPFVLKDPNNKPLEVPKGIDPRLYKVLRHQIIVMNYHFADDSLPKLKWAKGKTGDVGFYQDKYFFYQSKVDLVSFNSVYTKLKTKYGSPKYYAADSKISQIDTFTSLTWTSGDTVVFLVKMSSGDHSFDHNECILAYMNKSISEEIRKEIQTNYAEIQNEQKSKHDKTIESNLENVE